jgi:gluconolactonase
MVSGEESCRWDDRSRTLLVTMRPLFTAVLICSLFCLSFAESALYEATDLTANNVFTEGIEGPAVDQNGALYAVNFQEEGTIGRLNSNGQAGLFVKLPQGSVGNGIRFRPDGTMIVADYKGHNLLAVDMKSKAVSVWVHEPRMNQPNDLTIAKDGVVFASDPNWMNSTGNLWKVSQDGKVELVESGMGTTNGIEVSPDGEFLYVNESVQRKIWRYELGIDKDPKYKKLIAEFPDHGLDGMRCDPVGNLYVARYGKGTILKLTPNGKLLREIPLKGKRPTNLTFSKDGKIVYVTMQDRGSIEMFRVE